MQKQGNAISINHLNKVASEGMYPGRRNPFKVAVLQVGLDIQSSRPAREALKDAPSLEPSARAKLVKIGELIAEVPSQTVAVKAAARGVKNRATGISGLIEGISVLTSVSSALAFVDFAYGKIEQFGKVPLADELAAFSITAAVVGICMYSIKKARENAEKASVLYDVLKASITLNVVQSLEKMVRKPERL